MFIVPKQPSRRNVNARQARSTMLLFAPSRRQTAALLVLSLLILLGILDMSLTPQHLSLLRNTQALTTTTTVTISTPHPIESGVTHPTRVAYDHCEPRLSPQQQQLRQTTSPPVVQHLVLLHGSRYTKADWRTSGILGHFCEIPGLAVTTLDLLDNISSAATTTTTSQQHLLDVLADLAAAGVIALPIAALVTPSASGRFVLDGVTTTAHYQKTTRRLVAAIQRWIPVATNSVLKDQERSKTLLTTPELVSWPILAIHGDQDEAGKRTSALFQEWAGAVVKEVPGRHACYLDSPVVFVDTVVAFLGSDL